MEKNNKGREKKRWPRKECVKKMAVERKQWHKGESAISTERVNKMVERRNQW
jgi:hypothetical protein